MIAFNAKSLIRTFALAALVALAACITPTPRASVKDIAANKIGYLTDTFSVAKLPQDITGRISKDTQLSLGFRKMVIEVVGTIEDSGGKKTSANASGTLVNAGGAYVQEMWEWSNNGIAFSINYKLSYAGILSLKSQSIPLSYSYAPRISEVKELKQFSSAIARPRENSEYTIDYSAGLDSQTSNFKPQQIKCRAGKRYAANRIHPKLTGNGIDLDCEQYRNNVVSRRWKIFLMQQYGVGILVAATSSGSKSTYRITAVEVS